MDTKVKVTMEIEVENFDLFVSSLQSGLVAFADETDSSKCRLNLV